VRSCVLLSIELPDVSTQVVFDIYNVPLRFRILKIVVTFMNSLLTLETFRWYLLLLIYLCSVRFFLSTHRWTKTSCNTEDSSPSIKLVYTVSRLAIIVNSGLAFIICIFWNQTNEDFLICCILIIHYTVQFQFGMRLSSYSRCKHWKQLSKIK